MDDLSEPLIYDMLNNMEAQILSRRPLVVRQVASLYKGTLARFLRGNGFQCRPTDSKNILINLVFHAVDVTETPQQSPLQPAPLQPAPPQPAPLQPAPPQPAPPQQVSVPALQYHQFQLMHAPPAVPDLPGHYPHLYQIHRPMPAPYTPPSYQALLHPTYTNSECHCHECMGQPPPLPVQEAPFRQAEVMDDNNEEYDVNEELTHCDALLEDILDEPFPAHVYNPFHCQCQAPIQRMLRNTSLNTGFADTFRQVATSPISKVVEFLQSYGVAIDSSGCRIYLMWLLKDLLEEQMKALTSGGNPRSSGAAAGGAAATQGAVNDMASGFAIFKENTEAAAELDPQQECCICLQNRREVAFVPCGHVLCCVTCSNKLRDCSVCRKKIYKRLRIFYP